MIVKVKTAGCPMTNWIDGSGVVVGFDMDRRRCETFGCGVYDWDTGEFVAGDPDGMPYRFAKCADHNPATRRFADVANGDGTCGRAIHVRMIPDDGSARSLVFEVYNSHNGSYLHDFEMTVDLKGFFGTKSKDRI